MTNEEYTELRRMVDEVHNGDVHLGRVLHAMLDHLSELHGVGPHVPEAAPVQEAPKAPRGSKA